MNSAGYLPILPLVITPFPLFITPFSAVYHPSLSGGRGATDAGAAAAKRGVGTGARGGGLKGTDPTHTIFQMKFRQYEITSRHYREAEPNLWLL